MTRKRIVIATGVIVVVILSVGVFSWYTTSPNTHYRLGLEYQRKGMYAKAVLEFHRVIELDPSHGRAWVGLGTAYARRGMYDRAIEELQEGLNRNPAYADLWYTLGMVYLDRGYYQEAAKELQEALRLAPHQLKEGIHFNLAYALSQVGLIDQAIREYHAGLVIDSTAVDPHLSLAALYIKREKYEEAAAEYQAVLSLKAGEYRAMNGLGTA
ncbi:MAG: tetratricopeptide repeat protein, partial [Candidatus Latescibacteria bacterium]|nr:tetratricopeptide repeat protein [Candidatus Latescibacterota bacterium]